MNLVGLSMDLNDGPQYGPMHTSTNITINGKINRLSLSALKFFCQRPGCNPSVGLSTAAIGGGRGTL